MLKLRVFLGLAVLATLFVAGGLLGEQDSTTKFKGVLPANWSKLGLTDAQKQQTYKVQTEFGQKIDILKAQITKLQEEERAELIKILTNEQRNRLKDILAEKAGLPSKDEKK